MLSWMFIRKSNVFKNADVTDDFVSTVYDRYLTGTKVILLENAFKFCFHSLS